MVKARITSKGQVTIPKKLRDRLDLEPGDELDFEVRGERLEAHPVRRRRLGEFRGLFRVDRAHDIRHERRLAREERTRSLTDGAAGASS